MTSCYNFRLQFLSPGKRGHQFGHQFDQLELLRQLRELVIVGFLFVGCPVFICMYVWCSYFHMSVSVLIMYVSRNKFGGFGYKIQ